MDEAEEEKEEEKAKQRKLEKFRQMFFQEITNIFLIIKVYG